MGFFAKLFKKKTLFVSRTPQKKFQNPDCQQLWNLKLYMDAVLEEPHYVAKSEFRKTLEKQAELVSRFSVLQSSNTLDGFGKRNGMPSQDIAAILEQYKQFESIVDAHNDSYIENALKSEKVYLDGILRDVDPNIRLDADQRRVVLTDEDYCLVIAGAGAGKTTTVAAKVKYLVEKQGISPKQILVVSFTNKAVQELRDKINTDLNIECPISTFHSVGNAILRKQTPERLNIVDSGKLYFFLQNYFKSSILQNESLVNNLILFFASYIDAPYEGTDMNSFFNDLAKGNFATLRSDFDEFCEQVIDARTKRTNTIQNEVLRSRQEVEIANFLYLNQIEYQYEPIYPYNILLAKKPYTPDFMIRQGDKVAYIEHFGITQDGKSHLFDNAQLTTYKGAILDKIDLHKKHGTDLIYTFSQYTDRRPLQDHLREELLRHGFTLQPRSNREVLEKLISTEENRYIRKLVSLICRFIENFKTNGYGTEDFSRMYHSTQNARTRLFLDICNDCYLEYQRYLKENNAVDFQDMINESARVLREVKEMKQKLDFKYIIVDEYQDISRQRFDLVSALSAVTDSKIIAVGDDWQSIYAFSGSDITLFTRFAEKMGYAKMLKIVNTYRNSQEVIDIAGGFIQKNTTQISKALRSPKNITDPVIIYTYDGSYKKAGASNRSGANYALAHAVETAIEQIIAFNRQEGKPDNSSILLLGRFGFDGRNLEKSGLFEYVEYGNKLRSVKYPKQNITFMTAHASKGLGYDNVIVVNCKNETYGFPAKIEDDPVLSFVIKGDRSIDYAEERRLFYVAMTRTKNRVFLIAPEQNPSEFLLEIKHDYTNVVLRGNWNEETLQNNAVKKTCPLCGYPMQYRYKKAYGLRLYLCTNEPEVCGFMTNEIGGGKMSILKCERCRDGYLIVKPGNNGNYFLGCTNYKQDGTGCGNSMSKQQYYEMMGYKPDAEPQIELPTLANHEARSKANRNVSSDRMQMQAPKAPEVRKAQTQSVTFENADLNTMVHTVLQCLANVSEIHFYGTTMLTDILRGVDNERIRNNKLNMLPKYGALRNVRRESIFAMIEWLIEEEFILKTKHPKYPVLHPTYNGLHYDEIMTTAKLKKLQQRLTETM